jgi:hypothetical protein
MSHPTANPTPITLPLTAAMHQVAHQFFQRHQPGAQAKQVYLNTLAVLTVNNYCQMLGIETDLERAECWQFPIQMLADVADLPLGHRGSLECRPVLPQADTCSVPAESWEDRLGFVAVQFDASWKLPLC